MANGALPANLEFSLVEACPLPNESLGPPRQIAGEQGAVESDSGSVTGIASVKMRRVVVAEEHEDGDSVGGADSWDPGSIRSACDTSECRIPPIGRHATRRWRVITAAGLYDAAQIWVGSTLRTYRSKWGMANSTQP